MVSLRLIARASSADVSARRAYRRGIARERASGTAQTRLPVRSRPAFVRRPSAPMIRREATVCHGADASRLLCSRQLVVREPATLEHRHGAREPLAVRFLPAIEPEGLFVNVR